MKGAEGNVLHHHMSQLYLLHRQTPARVLPLTWNSLEEEKQESHEAGEELHGGRSRLQCGDRTSARTFEQGRREHSGIYRAVGTAVDVRGTLAGVTGDGSRYSLTAAHG